MKDHLALGKGAEKLAFAHLRHLGYDVVARNYRGRTGEIDLVAYDGPVLAFVEVKSRRSVDFGQPYEAVGPEKEERIRRAALEFLRRYKIKPTYRFDIVSVVYGDTPDVRLIKNAF
ncbi:MAG: YraN family protein [Acidobacteria bacterium]|nr:YraN family protein [Acidobacteriota bacterium]